MKIKPKLSLGQIVFLVIDPDQYERIVVGINVTFNGFLYELRDNTHESSFHSYIEISEVRLSKDDYGKGSEE